MDRNRTAMSELLQSKRFNSFLMALRERLRLSHSYIFVYFILSVLQYGKNKNIPTWRLIGKLKDVLAGHLDLLSEFTDLLPEQIKVPGGKKIPEIVVVEAPNDEGNEDEQEKKTS